MAGVPPHGWDPPLAGAPPAGTPLIQGWIGTPLSKVGLGTPLIQGWIGIPPIQGWIGTPQGWIGTPPVQGWIGTPQHTHTVAEKLRLWRTNKYFLKLQ